MYPLDYIEDLQSNFAPAWEMWIHLPAFVCAQRSIVGERHGYHIQDDNPTFNAGPGLWLAWGEDIVEVTGRPRPEIYRCCGLCTM